MKHRIVVETWDADGSILQKYHLHDPLPQLFTKDGKPCAMLASIIKQGFEEVNRGAALLVTREWDK
jgi:hypothetical protein